MIGIYASVRNATWRPISSGTQTSTQAQIKIEERRNVVARCVIHRAGKDVADAGLLNCLSSWRAGIPGP